jgi:hypothetical protein
MGQALECAHPNPENNDLLQRTTTGLAVYQPMTGLSTFTDGWRHWALTSDGIVAWTGTSADPPLDAGKPSHDTTQPG